MKLRSTAIFLFVLAPALSWNYKTKQSKILFTVVNIYSSISLKIALLDYKPNVNY